jgi:hypothetical protein
VNKYKLKVEYPGYPVGTLVELDGDGKYVSSDSILWFEKSFVESRPNVFELVEE